MSENKKKWKQYKTSNKISAYIKDDMLEEMKALSEEYDITPARILRDCWKIAKNCNCPTPKGVVIYRERGRAEDE